MKKLIFAGLLSMLLPKQAVAQTFKEVDYAPDGRVIKSDVTVAKNYLSEQEVDELNSLTTAFLDIAERRARRHLITTMKDWKQVLEQYLKVADADILPNAGSVTHEEAEAKALSEYEKFWRIQDKTLLSDFDKFIEDMSK